MRFSRFFSVALLLFFVSLAQADWNTIGTSIVDEDLFPTGNVAVDITNFALADDFYTVEFDDDDDLMVSSIHFCGAWLDDVLPADGAGDVSVSVGIHENNNVGGENQPGTLVWNGNFIPPTGGWLPCYLEAQPCADSLQLDWMTPNDGNVTENAATETYQYDLIFVDGAPTLEQDEHYWLVLKAGAENASLGWVTTEGIPWSPGRWGNGGPPWGSGGIMFLDNGGNNVPVAFDLTGSLVPEPATWILLLGGIVMVPFLRKCRAKYF